MYKITSHLPAIKNFQLVTIIALVLALLIWQVNRTFAQDGADTLTSSTTNESSEQTVNAATLSGCGNDLIGPVDLAFEQRVVELTNIERAKQGLPPMKLVAELANAARYHAADMAQDDYFDHDSFDRVNDSLTYVCDTWDRIKNFYPSPRAENIAAGYGSPEEVVQGWIDSPGHYRNIMGDAREIGVGYYYVPNSYRHYWVQNFGSRGDIYPLIINGEAGSSDSNELTIYAYGNWEDVRLRTDGNEWSGWQSFQNQINHTIYGEAGTHTVFAELRSGNQVVASSDTIELTRDFPRPNNAIPTPTPQPAQRNVAYEYYEGDFNELPDFDLLTPTATGQTTNFTLNMRLRDDNFAFRFKSCIDISTSGEYTFFSRSDDGSQLFINGQMVVDNDGLHNEQELSGTIYLPTGQHAIDVAYFEKGGGEMLEVSIAGPEMGRQPIPSSLLVVGCGSGGGPSPTPEPNPTAPPGTAVIPPGTELDNQLYLPLVTRGR